MVDKYDISEWGKKDQYEEKEYGYRILRYSIQGFYEPNPMNHILHPYVLTNLKSNISFMDLQSKSFKEVLEWVQLVRTELKDNWDEGITTYVGKRGHEISDQFDKLKEYPIHKFFIEDELYPDYIGILKNFSKLASGVNQFFRGILESKINGKSIYDYLSKDELFDEFKYTIVQKVRFDKMFMYSNYLSVETMKFNDNRYIPSDDYFMCFYERFIVESHKGHHSNFRHGYDDFDYYDFPIDEDRGKIGFWFEDYNFNKQNKKKNRIGVSSSFVKEFLKTNPVGFLGDNRQGFNVEGDEEYFAVRWYYEDKMRYRNHSSDV